MFSKNVVIDYVGNWSLLETPHDGLIERRWTKLQGVAGTAEAVPILQDIVKASPDGEVSVAPLPSEVVIVVYRFYTDNHGGGGPGLTL